MAISFRTKEGGDTLELVDWVERRQLEMRLTPAANAVATDAEAGASDAFRFPVDAATTVSTRTLELAEAPTGLLRNGEGDQLSELVPGTDGTFPQGTYVVELDGPMKVYVRLTGALSVTATLDRLELSLDAEREVAVGARTYHQRPAATVRTTGEPTDLLRAISTFSSALKTTSCERSYPTLRGHPPTLEVGETASIPDALSVPETGVRLELPAERRYAFVAAPLAYYLGAECVPASRPRLVTDAGLDRPLDDPREFDEEVARLLRRVVFLDCLTRTEGHYDVSLHERRVLEDAIDLSFESLYGRSIPEQLEAYLSVPFETLSPQLPQWPLTADVPPTPERISLLPYLVDDLAVVRAADGKRLAPPEVRSRVVEQLWDDEPDVATRASSAPRGDDGADPPPVVGPPDADSLTQVWFGEGVPVGASKGLEAAYRHRLDRDASADEAGITVVCNGDVGGDEGADVEAVYGSAEFGFDPTLRSDVPVDELAALLESDGDFLHYVGHIDDAGFECPDGTLDVSSLGRVGINAFLLNACRSYRQGVGLVERGAVGGVVTFTDVVDSGAVRVGRAMAQLLNRGFPLQSAYAVASGESIVGGNYLVVGDGTVDVVQPKHGAPILCDLAAGADADYELTVRAYLPSGVGVGALAIPYVADNDEYFLPPGRLATFQLSDTEIREYLTWFDDPIRRDGTLYWTDGAAAPEGLLRDLR
jgi:hypothetical protein